MDRYAALTANSLKGEPLPETDVRWIMTGEDVELLPLLNAAYTVRRRRFGVGVRLHVLNNVQSGACTEDCKYCAQSREAPTGKHTYPFKPEAEIVAAARRAYEDGAFRYCMVFSGRDLGRKRIDRICALVEKLKSLFPLELCVSAGFLSGEDGRKLAAAGVNRYNHNLNTSRRYYGDICTTHEYRQRVATIREAHAAGLEICSGVIIGMGETIEDFCSMIADLRGVNAQSIPVNFFIPVEGHRVSHYQTLTPHYCLKALCVFRLAFPDAEIRAAGGREHHLRSLQPMCLYAVNSLFARGYLTTGGDDVETTRRMIVDAGFAIEAPEY